MTPEELGSSLEGPYRVLVLTGLAYGSQPYFHVSFPVRIVEHRLIVPHLDSMTGREYCIASSLCRYVVLLHDICT